MTTTPRDVLCASTTSTLAEFVATAVSHVPVFE